MAAGSLPAPGTKYGPCIERTCKHRDCAQTREMADTLCPLCNEPIGYDDGTYHSQFYHVAGNGENSPRVLKHADCAEREVERERGER